MVTDVFVGDSTRDRELDPVATTEPLVRTEAVEDPAMTVCLPPVRRGTSGSQAVATAEEVCAEKSTRIEAL